MLKNNEVYQPQKVDTKNFLMGKELLHALFELVSRYWNLFIETGKSVTLAEYRMLCVDVVNT